jgi:hypothetical protein
MKAKTQRTFRIIFRIEEDDYLITPLRTDPAVARRAFRFAKQTGDRAVYDVRIGGEGMQCECLGFLHWGHCKHCQTLEAASRVFRLAAPAPA